jgi:ATP-dependent RNA helicase RhlE
MNFSELGLKPELVTALAGAQTGTGKTAGFVLPILQRLGNRGTGAPRALILTPTRELAAQVAESVRHYGKHTNLRSAVIFGGVSERPQIEALRNGCDILVATPGRLLDLINQKYVSLAQIEVFVLDEADRMLDMGFIHTIKKIRTMLPQQRQNLMFSATYSDDIRQLAGNLLRDPQRIDVAPPNKTADRVEQVAYRLPKEHKRHLLAHLINEGNWHQVLVFTRTKHGANRLAEQLARSGIPAMPIHGNKSQNARVRALEDFKSNRIIALVATEVAARGLDIKELPYVVNFELPNVPEDYVHRIGRTARAGSTGKAISLVSPDEAPYLKDIVRLLGRDLPTLPLPAFDMKEPPPAPNQPAQPQASQQPRRHSAPPRQRQHSRAGGGGRGRGGHGAPAAARGAEPRR